MPDSLVLPPVEYCFGTRPVDIDNGFGGSSRHTTGDREEVAIKLAGVGAELIFREMGKQWSFLLASSGRGDWIDVQCHLGSLGGDRRASLREAKAEVTELLQNNWPQVLRIAQLLRERRHLNGAEIVAA